MILHPISAARCAVARGGRASRTALSLAIVFVGALCGAAFAADAPGPSVDAIATPLEGRAGDAARGRMLLARRDPANCVLCHAMGGIAPAGNLGPALDGVGTRFTAAQLRLRVVDMRSVAPQTIMPSYHRTDGLRDVAPRYAGAPILDAQSVEDVVAYLSTLK